MWRKPPVGLVAGAVAVASVLGGCGGHSGAAGSRSASSGSAAGRGAGVLSIHPASGGTTTAFRFGFSVPDAGGRRGDTQLGYELAVLGPAHAGCLSARSAGVAARTAGARATITLDPGEAGERWCVGTYRARVTETATPVCAQGTMCPQFIRVVRTVAIGTFRVPGP